MSSLEVYINDGEVVMSTRFYPEGKNVGVKLSGEISAAVYEIEKENKEG